MVDAALSLEQANDKSRLACVAQCHERLRIKFDEDGNLLERPKFQVYREACPQFIRTVPSIPSDPLNPEDAWTDGEDHFFDSWKYGLASWPLSMSKPLPVKTYFEKIQAVVESRDDETLDLPWQRPASDEDEGFFQDQH
jgi:hypothetical protein